MMKQCIITAIFLPIYLFAQDTSSIYNQKLDQLRSHLGIIENGELDIRVYNTLVESLDSLGIKDEQLQDGFEWGGGKAGFEAYIKNNIDRLISDFSLISSELDSLRNKTVSDSLMSQSSTDSYKAMSKPILIEEPIKPVEDLYLETEQPIKIVEKTKNVSTKKSKLSGLRINASFGKPLAVGSSLSQHASYFEPMISVRTPLGIRIGPVFTSLGYETSKFSFEAPSEIDTLNSYIGSGSGPALFFDISKIIKIGGPKFGKYFMVGLTSSDYGSGFVGGYDLTMFLGSFPISLSVSSRMNIITFDGVGTSYWVSASAGLGIDIR